MTYSDFIGITEAVWTALALVGIALGVYLLNAERRDRAMTVAQNGRVGILSWALVWNEVLRVAAHVILVLVGIGALATPNLTAPPTVVAPFVNGLMPVLALILVAKSAVMIYARQRIARYPIIPEGVAQQETLLEVQHDVGVVAKKVGEANAVASKVQDKLAALTVRADVSERRADVAEERADK